MDTLGQFAATTAFQEKLRTLIPDPKKPGNVSWEEWEKIRITGQKVLDALNRTLSNANRVYCNERRIIKTDHAFIEREDGEDGEDQLIGRILDVVLEDNASVSGYERLINRKRWEYKTQSQAFEAMVLDVQIQAFLENWKVNSNLKERLIQLNDVQKADVNRLLQKRYGILQYEMGHSKSLCGLAMAQYQLVAHLFWISLRHRFRCENYFLLNWSPYRSILTYCLRR